MRDLTQDALAEQVGCAVQTIRMVEAGTRRPSRELAERLAHILAVPDAERADFLHRARQRELPVTEPVVEPVGVTEPATVAAEAQALRTGPRHAALPSTPNPLIGRQHEHAKVRTLVGEEGKRLVTLVGPGGVGKTRLALQLAADLQPYFANGVAWVALAPLPSAEHVASTVADALGLPLQGAATPADQLLAYLRPLQLLLVFDNFEHVQAASDLLRRILEVTSDVRLLVTSRERLRLQAEWVVQLGGLAVPARDSGDDVVRSEAVLLFLDRARRTSSEFVLDRSNQAAVAEICRRLDGLPLALELAAARVKLLPPPALLQRLNRVLPLLARGARDLPERQRTMSATLQWSYDLLSPEEQALFRRLAVFRGGWTLEGVEVAGVGPEVDDEELLNLVASLVDKSLVVAETNRDGEPRYRMLEPIREYARERLDESGETEELQRRHAEHYRRLAEGAKRELRGPRQVEWLSLLSEEHDNLRAAFGWLLERGEVEAVAHLAASLQLFWWIRGYHVEGRRWMEEALKSRARLSPDGAAKTLWVCGQMATGQGDHAAAEAYFSESYELFQAAGNGYGAAHPGLGLALLALGAGEGRRAEQYLSESAEASREAKDPFWAALSLNALGRMSLGAGDFDRARSYLADGLALARQAGDRFSRYIALYNQSVLAQAEGDQDRAAALFKEVLIFSREAGDNANVAYCLEGLAEVAVAQGEPERAAWLMGAAQGLRETVGVRVYTYRAQAQRPAYERAVAAARSALGDAAWSSTWERGRALPLDQAVAYALSSEKLPNPA